MDRAFAREAAGSSLDDESAAGESAIGGEPDPFAALERAFAAQRDEEDSVEAVSGSTDGRALAGVAPDPFAALDRAFAREAAGSSLDDELAAGESAIGGEPDPFAALEQAFAAQAAAEVTEREPEDSVAAPDGGDGARADSAISAVQPSNLGDTESAAVVATVENRAAWMAAVDASVAAVEQGATAAEAAAAGPGRWCRATHAAWAPATAWPPQTRVSRG